MKHYKLEEIIRIKMSQYIYKKNMLKEVGIS